LGDILKTLFAIAPFVCALTVLAAHAATPAKSPVGLDTMRKSFSAALAAKDLNAAIKLSSFPLAVAVYQLDPKMSEAQFRKSISSLGLDDAGDQHCIANDPLTLTDAKSASDKRFANAWVADCNGSEYYFAQRKGAWMFIGYENINE
jgi:hypothetical protein